MRNKCCLCKNLESRGGLGEPTWVIGHLWRGLSIEFHVHRVCFLKFKKHYEEIEKRVEMLENDMDELAVSWTPQPRRLLKQVLDNELRKNTN